MRNFRWWLVFSNGLLASALAQPVHAAVNSEVTRVIFNAGETRYSLALINSPQQPALVQVWTDKGDPGSQPNSVITPVVAMPPVFKMQPGELRNIRLQLTDTTGLAQDRESLFWLNIFQIPPMTENDAQQAQKIVLPLRVRMKVFIRPKGVSALKEDDARKLGFNYSGPQNQLTVTNPTPWHITFAGISCEAGTASGVMVAPFATLTLALEGAGKRCSLLRYEVINDGGNRWAYEKATASGGR